MSTTRTWMVGVLGLLAACGADDAPADDEDTTGVEPGDESGACIPGYEGCACAPGDVCLGELACLSQICVDMGPSAETSTGGADTTPAEESTGGEETSTSSPVTADGSTSQESSTTEPASTDESSTTALEPVCFEGDNYCNAEDSMFMTCVEGQWQESTCVEQCALTGYGSPGCADTDGCLCEGFTDIACEEGSLGLCYCAEVDFAIPCTTEQWTEFYDQCIAGVDYAVCFIDYPYIDGPPDCAAAEAACL
jgi:hypothetical protein